MGISYGLVRTLVVVLEANGDNFIQVRESWLIRILCALMAAHKNALQFFKNIYSFSNLSLIHLFIKLDVCIRRTIQETRVLNETILARVNLKEVS